MPNVINSNPQFPDLFLGASEQSGTIPNEKGEDISYHNFILDIAIADREVNSNTVSSCGLECLGFSRTTVDGKTKFTDKRKIKAENVALVFGIEIPNAEFLNTKVFQNCEVLWDKNGSIKRITFEEPFPKMVTKSVK